MKIQIGSRNEADRCCVQLLSLPSCILPGFPGLETCLPSHKCSMQLHCVGNIQNRFGSALRCDCSYTCSFMIKHPEQQMVLAKEKMSSASVRETVFGRLFTSYPRGFSSKWAGGNPGVIVLVYRMLSLGVVGGVICIVEEMLICPVFMWCWEWTNVKLSGEESKTVAGNSSTWRTEDIHRRFFTSYSAMLLQFKI